MSDFLNTSRPINGILHSSAASGVTRGRGAPVSPRRATARAEATAGYEAASSRHLLRVRLSVGCGRLAVLGRHLPRYRAGLVLRLGERPRSRLQCGTFNAEHPALLRVVGIAGTSRTVTCGAVSNTACSLSGSGAATRIGWWNALRRTPRPSWSPECGHDR